MKCLKCGEKLTQVRQLSLTEMKALKSFIGSEQTHALGCKKCQTKEVSQ